MQRKNIIATLAIIFLLTGISGCGRQDHPYPQSETESTAYVKDSLISKENLYTPSTYENTVHVGDTFVARITETGEIMTAGQGSNGFTPDTSDWGKAKRVFTVTNGLAAVDTSGALHISLFDPKDIKLNECAEVINLVDAGMCLIGLSINGEISVIYDPCNDAPDIMPQISDGGYKKISGNGSANSRFLCYLTHDGYVGMTYYSDDKITSTKYEKMKHDISSWRDIVDISASSDHVLGLKSDGTVVATAEDKEDSVCSVQTWKNIIMIAAGDGHSVGLDANGKVWACGANGWGQINVSSWHDIVYITAGGWNTLAIDQNGNYYFCGKIDVKKSNVFKNQPVSKSSPIPTPTSEPIEYTPFTNVYGTPTTRCAHKGCHNYIASSGDTNCCEKHSNRCLECNKYIDEDALYCMSCIENVSSSLSGHYCLECGKPAYMAVEGLNGTEEWYCEEHWKELVELMDTILGN